MTTNNLTDTRSAGIFSISRQLRFGRTGTDRRFQPALPRFSADPLGYLQDIEEWTDDPVLLPMGAGPVHVPVHFFSSPAAIEHVLASGQRYFRKSFTNAPARSIFGMGVLTSDGDSWLEQRRRLRPLFRPDRLPGHAEATRRRVDALSDRWNSAAKEGRVVDVTADMAQLSVEVLMESVFGTSIRDDQVAAVAQAFRILSEESWRRTTDPIWWAFPRISNALPTRRRRNFVRAQRELRDVSEWIASTTSGRSDGGLVDLMTRAGEQGSGVDAQLLHDEIATFLVAGHETTAASLAWGWHLLGLRPDAG